MGRCEEAGRLQGEVYFGRLKIHGEEHVDTFSAALNYASTLLDLRRYEEAKSLLRKTLPVARRVLGTCRMIFMMRGCYAQSIHDDPKATLDDLREALTTLEDTAQTARRVLGGAHPTAALIERNLRAVRAILRARETPPEAV